MNSVDFCYWLQGYFEISDSKSITDKQVEIIKNHLNLVFKHEIDPMRESETTTPSNVLNQTHQGKSAFKTPGYIPDSKNDQLVRC